MDNPNLYVYQVTVTYKKAHVDPDVYVVDNLIDVRMEHPFLVIDICNGDRKYTQASAVAEVLVERK